MPTAKPAGGGAPEKTAPDSVISHSIPAVEGERLVLDVPTTGAEIEIRGWDERRVTVHALLRGRDWPDTRMDVERMSRGVLVRTTYLGGRRESSFANRFVIRVPRRYDVELRSAGGDFELRDVDGTFTGTTGGGAIQITRARGLVELTTGGGDVHVWDAELDGRVSTGGGSVLIERVRGGLRGSSGTGDVSYGGSDITINPDDGDRSGDRPNDRAARRRDRADARDEASQQPVVWPTTTTTNSLDEPHVRWPGGKPDVSLRKAGGDIRVGEAPNGAQLHTGGGTIRVGRAARHVGAVTGGGDIVVGPVDGSVDAHTGAGNVSVSLSWSAQPGHDVAVTTGYGNVDLYLPADFPARLELESAYTNNLGRRTRVESPWPLAINETDTWDDREGTPRRYVRGTATFGDGRNVIRVRAVNGDVRLHLLPATR